METMILAAVMAFHSWFHPVHVSLLNVDINPEAGKIEIVFKLYSEDIQQLILNKYNVDLNLANKVDPSDKVKFINEYIEESFVMRINGTKIETWNYTTNEMNEESIWLYYKSTCPGNIKEVSITDSVMMDFFEDQTNMVIVSYSGKQNGYTLNNKNRDITLILQ